MKSVEAYPWQRPDLPLIELKQILETRREQLLDVIQDSPKLCEGNFLSEWMALMRKRDEVIQELIKQENKKSLVGHLMRLQDQLLPVCDFYSCLPEPMRKTISSLCQQLQHYVSEYKATEPVFMEQIVTDIYKHPVSVTTQTDCITGDKQPDILSEATSKEQLKHTTLHEEQHKTVAPQVTSEQHAGFNFDKPLPPITESMSGLTSATSQDSNGSAPVTQSQSSYDTANVSRNSSLSFMAERQQNPESDVSNSTAPSSSNFLDAGLETVTDIRPIRASTPHDTDHQKDDLARKVKPGRRHRGSHQRSRRKAKSANSSADVSNSYRPTLWGMVTTVIGWYNGNSQGKNPDSKPASLQISID